MSSLVRYLVTETAAFLESAATGSPLDHVPEGPTVPPPPASDGWLFLPPGSPPLHRSPQGLHRGGLVREKEARHRDALLAAEGTVHRFLVTISVCQTSLETLRGQQERPRLVVNGVGHRPSPGQLHAQCVIEKTLCWAHACVGLVELLLSAALTPPCVRCAPWGVRRDRR